MAKVDHRLEILERARNIIRGDSNLSSTEQEELIKMIDLMAAAVRDYAAPSDHAPRREHGKVTTRHALLSLLKQQADELDTLKKLSLNLTSSLDLQTVLDAVVSEAMRLVKNARTAHIFLFRNNLLEFGAALSYDGERNKAISIPRNDGLTYAVAKKGETILVEDMSNHPLYLNAPAKPAWTGSIIGIPLKINNLVVGVMNLSRSNIGWFTSSELRLISLLSDQAAVAISNASLHKMVSQQAMSDMITGLPNRRALDEHLEQEVLFAQRTKSQFAVIMMDLDGFKAINDTHGHALGDEILKTAFNFLAANMRANDFLARYGGDELTLILRQTDAEAARSVTNKLLEKMSEYRYALPNGHEIKLGVSCGIAMYPAHARNSVDLLRAADAALYVAKKHYRGSFVFSKGATGPLNPITLPRSMQ
ncbi:MAG: sensor domain-containing diguanylate cyclase [Anaerolineales bacterium]|nr:sensor domain-containing diguanylate cyclase [Anaerolineales bacterium]